MVGVVAVLVTAVQLTSGQDVGRNEEAGLVNFMLNGKPQFFSKRELSDDHCWRG